MKLRSKLLLSATCLLTISVAATATSAYAWFVSNRQASVTINSATIKTNATNLKIAGVEKGEGDTATLTTKQGDPNVVTASASTIKATDISGNGVTFFKPKLAPDFTTTYKATSISKVSNGGNTNYYHQFKLEFSQDNANVNTGVFLSTDSSVSLSTGPADNGLHLCTRVAFIKETNNKAKPYELLLYWAPNRETASDANASYIKAAYNDESNTPVKDPVSIKDGDPNSEVLESVSTITKTIYGTPEDVNDATLVSNKQNAKEHLLTLAGTAKQTIIVRIWFEGMDKNCKSDYLEQTIDANLEFNGVNMDI